MQIDSFQEFKSISILRKSINEIHHINRSKDKNMITKKTVKSF